MHYFLKIISEQPYISGIRRKINTCVTWNNWIKIIPNLVNIPEDSQIHYLLEKYGVTVLFWNQKNNISDLEQLDFKYNSSLSLTISWKTLKPVIWCMQLLGDLSHINALGVFFVFFIIDRVSDAK